MFGALVMKTACFAFGNLSMCKWFGIWQSQGVYSRMRYPLDCFCRALAILQDRSFRIRTGNTGTAKRGKEVGMILRA